MTPSIYIPKPTAGIIDRVGVGRGLMADLLAASPFDLITHDFVFMGDTMPAEIVTATNGTSAALTPTATTSRGLGLVTGTDDNGYAGIGTALAFKGDLGVLAEFLLEIPSTKTTLKFEAGLTDALGDAGAVNAKGAGPTTATATDFAVFVHDTDDDANLATVSAKGGTVVENQDLVAVAGSDKLYLAVRAIDDNVEFFYAQNQTRSLTRIGHGGGAGIEGGSALTPWVFAQARAGSASRTVTVLRMRVTGALL
ncbi:MAG: hypothetical protein KC458_05650 [Dehalococcoidia bacterium]|nr:hypothetical protein [Dehalococcoidia bacterium]